MTSKVGSFGIAVVVALFFLSHGMTACAQVANLFVPQIGDSTNAGTMNGVSF